MTRHQLDSRDQSGVMPRRIGHTLTANDAGCRALSWLTFRSVESRYTNQHSSSRIIPRQFVDRVEQEVRNGESVAISPVRGVVATGNDASRAARFDAAPRATLGLSSVIDHVMGSEVRACLTSALANLPEPTIPRRAGAPSVNPDLIEFVHFEHLGLVTFSAGVNPYWLIAQVVLAFSRSPIAIVCQSRDAVRRMTAALASYGIALDEPYYQAGSDLLSDDEGAKVARIVVGTATSMAEAKSAIGLRELVIFPDAVEAIGEVPQNVFASPHARFRLLGFARADRSLSPRQHDLLMAAYGPERLHIPAHGFGERDVRVVPYDYRRSAVAHELNPFSTRRELIWRDHLRNSRIARVASLLSTGEGAALHEFAPGLASHLSVVSPRPVTIMVDAIEHAIALAKRLKRATVMCSQHVDLDGLDEADRRILAPRPWSWQASNLVIATLDAIETMPPGTLQTVIWAGSGPHRPLLPEPQLAAPADTPDDGVLIVDVGDYHTPLLQQWTRQRRREYDRAEWLPVNADPVRHRIERFVASRPGGRR